MSDELYIVEGSSAASTLRQAVSGGSTQQVWSMRGKLPNVSKLVDSKVMANKRCRELIAILGGAGRTQHSRNLATGNEHVQSEEKNWDNIYVVSDADIDGQHATVLLLAIVERFLPELVRNGRLHVITTPLYRVQQGGKVIFAFNEQERVAMQNNCSEKISLTRFKGVAQMSFDECRRFVLTPLERRSVQLTMSEQNSTRQGPA